MAEYLKQSFIEDITLGLRKACGYEDTNLIDMEDVIEKVGFTLTRYEDDSNVNGKVLNSETIKEIHINTNSDRNERFTMAHEIGHIVLHHNDYNGEEMKIDYRTEGDGYSQKEFQANMFASAFLMPKIEAIKVWDLVCDIEEFSNLFKVSLTSAKIRLKILGLV